MTSSIYPSFAAWEELDRELPEVTINLQCAHFAGGCMLCSSIRLRGVIVGENYSGAISRHR